MSTRFAKAAYEHENKVRIVGVTRKKSRGLPKCVVQEEMKNKTEVRSVQGTVKTVVLKGDNCCPDLVAVSFYDTKPVHFLSTICEGIKWRRLKREMFCVDTGKPETVTYLRLNIRDDYNKDMGHVDISNQLQNQYRFDHWMQKTK